MTAAIDPSHIIHVCPAHSEYRFRDACRIDTCQYHNKVTKQRCLALDRAEGDKSVSCVEVGIFKEYALQRSNGDQSSRLTQKGTETAVRRQGIAVRESMRLYLYVGWLDENGLRSLNFERELSEEHAEHLALMVDDLHHIVHELRPHMIPYLFHAPTIAHFAKTVRSGMSPEPFNFRVILGKRSRLPSNLIKELHTSCLNCLPSRT